MCFLFFSSTPREKRMTSYLAYYCCGRHGKAATKLDPTNGTLVLDGVANASNQNKSPEHNSQ